MKKIYRITGMDCDSCAKMIELDLEDAGIFCKCSYTKETLELESDERLEEIKLILERQGYKLDLKS